MLDILRLIERVSQQRLATAQASQFFTEAVAKICDQMLPLCYSQELLDCHTQFLSVASAQNSAILYTLRNLVSAISMATLVRRDTFIGGLHEEILTRIRQALRNDPLHHATNEMFPEDTLREARRELDRRRGDQFSQQFRRAEVSSARFVARQRPTSTDSRRDTQRPPSTDPRRDRDKHSQEHRPDKRQSEKEKEKELKKHLPPPKSRRDRKDRRK